MSDSRDFEDVESVRSELSHVPIQLQSLDLEGFLSRNV